MFGVIDRDYANCCKNYIKQWITEAHAEHYNISEEVMDYFIVKGGNGIRELEVSFKKLLEIAEEYQIETIDKAYIDMVLS